MMSVNEIMREIVRRTSEGCGRHVSFLFGDWDYISDTLKAWGKSQATAKGKFPIVCLYSPYTEDRTGDSPSVSLSLLIAVNTRKDMENEERENVSFKLVLRPIYRELMSRLKKASDLIEPPYGINARTVPHMYTENYRYGRKGVRSGDGTPFCDYIDAIEITDLRITVKKDRCHANRL